MKRTIIKIDDELCNGCEACVSGCHEGALQMVDGKARIISELYCDGLGACIGECPVGAITLEERDAEPYDEIAVMNRISVNGEKTVIAHLKHLKDHNEMEYFKQGVEYIKDNNLNFDLSSLFNDNDVSKTNNHGNKGGGCPGSASRSFTPQMPKPQQEQPLACGCPGSAARTFSVVPESPSHQAAPFARNSELTHWPVQLHLLNPSAGHFTGQDILLAADCTAFAFPDFHSLLRGKKLAIACPKLDSNQETYIEKLTHMIDNAEINTLTVVIMEVPCCGGLLRIAQQAASQADRKVPVKLIVIGVQGNIVSERWI